MTGRGIVSRDTVRPSVSACVVLDRMTDRMRLQQRPDKPHRQQPSTAERRAAESPPHPGQPVQADRRDRQRKQRARQAVLQNAKEYRAELRNKIVVVAHRIGNEDPSPDKVQRKNERNYSGVC